jgi:GDPmannose 4,6-dehydratase
MPTALITGITGQDGSFVAEQLLEQGWTVHGLMRRSASRDMWRISHLLEKMNLIDGDMLDLASLIRALQISSPDCVYNLASQSHVPTSWTQPLYTGDVTGIGSVRLFEAVRLVAPHARIYQAGSSEMYGREHIGNKQNESTPFCPCSPYGAAKLYAHQMAVNYRVAYDMFIVNGILFNHESERRGEAFVTRKIAMAVGEFANGRRHPLRLGALDVRRDWGFAGDYTRAMTLMLEQDTPTDYVIASGRSWSVKDFLTRAFDIIDLDWTDHVAQDEKFFRPSEIPELCGDASKAREELGWKPSLGFDQLVERMVKAEISRHVNN